MWKLVEKLCNVLLNFVHISSVIASALMSYLSETLPIFPIFSAIQRGLMFPSWKNNPANQSFVGGENENEDPPATEPEDQHRYRGCCKPI